MQPIQAGADNGEPLFTSFYDVWIEEAGTEKPEFSYVCTTREADLQLREAIDMLYKTIDRAQTDVVLNPKIRNLLKSVIENGSI